MQPPEGGLERAKKVEDGLLVLGRECVETLDDGVGFGRTVAAGAAEFVVAIPAVRMVSLNCLEEIVGTAVVQEKAALADTPERSGAEHVAGGEPLGDVVGESLAHVVNQQI